MDFSKKWNEHLRRQTRKSSDSVKCPLPDCSQEIQVAAGPGSPPAPAFIQHLQSTHSKQLRDFTTEKEKTAWIQKQWTTATSTERFVALQIELTIHGFQMTDQDHRGGNSGQTTPPTRGSIELASRPATSTQVESQVGRGNSPSPSIKRTGSRSRSPSPPKRSKARHNSDTTDYDRRPPVKGGKLWSPDDGTVAANPRPFDKSNVATSQRLRLAATSIPKSSRHSQQPQSRGPPFFDIDETTELLKQPETRPISQEQLIAEVKGIYAGLVMVESKCIEVDNLQSQSNETINKLNNEQWQALIALHRTLLHEHHDFFLASQHPSASLALRRLAAKYAMPARMWRHGIHSFLELLRHRLPASLEHMLMFIYMAYSMMALLYETVPAFEDTWIECLGDLGRYRMAIEDDDMRDREIWTAVSRHWYSKASDKAPTTGRLYHHLAILARPNALQQLYYYTKSLCVTIPFLAARESIMTLFDPIMAVAPNQYQARLPSVDFSFTKAHGIMFSGKQQDKLQSCVDAFLQPLDSYIARSTKRFLEPGYHIAISNCCSVVGYGDSFNPIYKVFHRHSIRDTPDYSPDDEGHWDQVDMPNATQKQLDDTVSLLTQTYDIVARRFGDPNILPYLNSTLTFIYHLCCFPTAMTHLAPKFPWKLTAMTLNTLIDSCKDYGRIEGDSIPQSESPARPFPEDYAMRGLLWSESIYPSDWFVNDKINDDEKYFEAASLAEERRDRVLWLGCKIASVAEEYLQYNDQTHKFGVSPDYDIDLGTTTPLTPADSIEMGELPDAVTPA
ncbi:EST/SMG-like protein 1 [Podospora fimiseda]|uniref:EST/SMG-like protein 1 n=1 Tax=Podospora fimiseda TaxID=252190 RepID=A0AAN7BUA5_9PEZI|nr:EST/SMG-like protein 1 [Podospora fimiseda]